MGCTALVTHLELWDDGGVSDDSGLPAHRYQSPDASKVGLAPGARVSIWLPEGGTCVASISAIKGDDVEVDLLDDLEDGMPPAGTGLSMYVSRPNGLVGWRAVVKDERRGEAKASLTVGSPAPVVQRRHYVRVDVDLPAEARRIVAGRRGRVQFGRVADLSPGGLRLIGPIVLRTADVVEVTVDLGDGPVELRGPVVLSHAAPDGGRVVHVALGPERSAQHNSLVSFWAAQGLFAPRS